MGVRVKTALRRYHPTLVTLHWILAAMIIAALIMGTAVLAPLPNTAPEKYLVLRHHIQVGLAILVLMSLRFVVRQLTEPLDAAVSGRTSTDALALATHRSFYVLVFAEIATGLTMAAQAHLPQILFMGEHRQFPATFWVYAARGWHYVISRLLMALIGLHVAGVFYRTFVGKDHILRRMWFGQRIVPVSDTD